MEKLKEFLNRNYVRLILKVLFISLFQIFVFWSLWWGISAVKEVRKYNQQTQLNTDNIKQIVDFLNQAVKNAQQK